MFSHLYFLQNFREINVFPLCNAEKRIFLREINQTNCIYVAKYAQCAQCGNYGNDPLHFLDKTVDGRESNSFTVLKKLLSKELILRKIFFR